VHKPPDEERVAVLEAKKVIALMPGPGSEDDNGVPAPSARGALGKARAVANRAFAETIPVEADGHGNGHAVTGEEHEAVGAPGSTALPPGDGGEE
jgi:quinol---cytochrome-c reductase cytochrome b subunit